MNGKICASTFVVFFINACSLLASRDYVVTLEQLEHFKHNGCDLPGTLKYSFRIDGENIYLNLTRNNDFKVNVPVYLIKKTSHEKYDLIKQHTDSEQEFAFYEDSNTGASITARCSNKKIFSHDITGKFLKNGEELYIQPYTDVHVSRRKRNPVLYEVSPLLESTYKIHSLNSAPNFQNDYRIPDKVSENLNLVPKREHSNSETHSHRRKRAAKPNYYVDVLMFIEYSLYNRFYSRSLLSTNDLKKNEAITKIKEYYAHIARGMDIRYKAIQTMPFVININIAGIVIQETFQEAWSEVYRLDGDIIDADKELTSFKDAMSRLPSLPRHDHAMLFSGYDFYTVRKGQYMLGSTGLAYIDTLCRTDGASVSVVEEPGGFQSIKTATHELGHSLKAEHDGESNDCSTEDRYIMASTPGERTPLNIYNPWYFSVCSVDYFISKVNSLIEAGNDCLIRREFDSSVPDVSGILPGQTYSPDQICVDIHGPGSYYCRGLREEITTADICTDLYCKDPTKDASCVRYDAPRKMTCGNKKWCINGECAYDIQAPAADESCLFGDQPGIAYEQQTCDDLVTTRHDVCYQENVRSTCCVSCQKIHTGLQGCEYGDRIKGCRDAFCERGVIQSENGKEYNMSYSCCGTCETGTPVETTFTPPPTRGCVDVTLSGGVTCTEYIRQYGSRVCYASSVERSCCLSCQRVKNTAEPGCEYGDRDYKLCTPRNATDPRFCAVYERMCCETCRDPNAAQRLNAVDQNFMLFVLVLLYSVLHLVQG